jgi:hypothetical protein
MAAIIGPKYMGPFLFDLTQVQDLLVDLPSGALRGARTTQPGIDKVYVELEASMQHHAEAAEIPPQVYPRILSRKDAIALLREKELQMLKGAEVCRESRVKLENDQEDDIGIIANTAEETARRKKDPGVAAPFTETIQYHGQIAEKAVRTRTKNAEAKAEAEAKAKAEAEAKAKAEAEAKAKAASGKDGG